MTQRKQQTVIVHRIMQGGEKIVPTLVTTDRIILANDDESGDFTWLRYEVSKKAGKPEIQSWRIVETLNELLLLTNGLVPCEEVLEHSDTSDNGE